MRSTALSALKTVVILGGLAWISMNGFSLHAQVPQTVGVIQPGVNSQTPYPVGAPIYMAARETTVDSSKTGPADATAWPEAEWDDVNDESETKTGKFKSWTAWLPSFKKSKKKEDEILTDDGLDVIEWMTVERNFSDRDYVESATRDKDTAGKDFYARGMKAENLGQLDEAVRLYNAFIKLNAKQTTNGTLAAPYHRLALISWKQQRRKESDTYFRYAMKYAQGGNIAIVAGDYSLFLMEQGEIAKAEVTLRNALAYRPEDRRLLTYLGRCTARQQKPVEAMRHLTAALGEDQAYVEMAHMYRQMGEWETALVIDGKRNDYLAEKQKRSMPTRTYAYLPPQSSPVAAPEIPVPHWVTLPATTMRPVPATPVAMVAPPQGGVQHAAARIPEPTRETVQNVPQIFTLYSFPVIPETETPRNSSVMRLPAVKAPGPPVDSPSFRPRSIPVQNEGWQPYAPAATEPPLTGVWYYPSGMSNPLYYEYDRSNRLFDQCQPPFETAAQPGIVLR